MVNQHKALVHIIVGFTEGDWHVRRFERALRRHQYGITKDVTKADYVIAHSGGCYAIPPLTEKQMLMLIDPTYWPGRSIAERGKNMARQLAGAIKLGNKPHYHLWKTAHNFFYLAYHHKLNWFMIQQSQIYSLEQSINHGRTILVRNANDPWLTPHLDDLQTLHPKLEIVRMPGDHDDCWQNPEPYITALKSSAHRV